MQEPTPRHVAVKEVVLPFNKFPGADTLLGPEMRSTGEVMGIDYDFASSYAKAQIAAGALEVRSKWLGLVHWHWQGPLTVSQHRVLLSMAMTA